MRMRRAWKKIGRCRTEKIEQLVFRNGTELIAAREAQKHNRGIESLTRADKRLGKVESDFREPGVEAQRLTVDFGGTCVVAV
jgi:hypothetical protein